MRVFVAGASAESDRVRGVMAAIEASDVLENAHDWLSVIEDRGAPCFGLPDEAIRSAAIDDWNAVEQADALLLLAPRGDALTQGAWVELGIALNAGLPVYAAGDLDRCVYAPLCLRFDTDLAAVWELEDAARRHR